MDYTRLPIVYRRFQTRFLRLVKLKAGEPGHFLHFEVEIGSMSYDTPDYFALSYCWGDPSRKTEVVISGQVVQISGNLESALHHSGLAVGDLIWADAICINQGDPFEKSYQVNMMGLIYAKARRVIAWLGAEAQQSLPAVKLVTRLSKRVERLPLSSLHTIGGIDAASPTTDIFLASLSDLPHPARALQGLAELLSRPYWERVWIIQEIAKATVVEVRCGKLQIDLNGILYAATRHTGLSERHRTLLAAIFEFRAQEQRKAGRMPLIQAILTSRFSLATDERDKVYALLGLAEDSTDLVPTPDYEQLEPEAFEQLTKRIIESHHSSPVTLLAKRVPLSSRFPQSSPWAVDWAELACDIPQWLINTLNSAPKIEIKPTVLKGSLLRTKGRRLGSITSHETDTSSWMSYTPDETGPNSSFGAMSRIASDILERLSPGGSGIAAVNPKEMTLALARMIRDADKGSASAEYNLPRVCHTLYRLKDVQLHQMPIWEWARKANFHRPAAPRQIQEPIVADVSISYEEEPAACCLRPLGMWKSLFRFSRKSQAQRTTISNAERAALIVPSQEIPRSSSDESLDADLNENAAGKLDGTTPLPSLVAFKLWEDILASFSRLSEDQLQFAIVSNKHLVIVPRNARQGQDIYEIEHCTLPVVLGKDREGDYYLAGEAYVGRRPDGAWLPDLESLFPKIERPPDSADSAIKINLAYSAEFVGRPGRWGSPDWDSYAS